MVAGARARPGARSRRSATARWRPSRRASASRRYKTLAFGISAFYAGIAGSLYAIANAYVNPDVFPIILSVYLVVGLAVGGLDSLIGLIAGAGLIYFLQNHADTVARWINHLPALNLDPKQPGIPSMVFGIVLIVVMLLLPTGCRRLAATGLPAC